MAFNFNIVVLLLCGPLAETATSADATLRAGLRLSGGIVNGNTTAAGVCIVLALLLLFLFTLLSPDFVNIQKFDSD